MMRDMIWSFRLFVCVALFNAVSGESGTTTLPSVEHIEEDFECDEANNGTCCVLAEFQCHDGTCVPLSNLCDSNLHSSPQNGSLKSDCRDGSDEISCSETLCESRDQPCDQICTDLPNNKSRCFCVDGFLPKTSPNGLVCDDMDECKLGIHLCSQLCTNNNGSYTCSCEKGFYLDERGGHVGRCMAEHKDTLIMFSANKWIYAFDMNEKEAMGLVPSGRVDSMDYDPVTDIIYWWNNHQKTLSRSYLPSDDNHVTIGHEQKMCVTYEERSIARKHVAIDWTVGNVYWISIYRYETGITSSIVVSKLHGVAIRTLFVKKEVTITSLVLDPINARLYWTLIAEHESEISFSYSNGDSRKVYVKLPRQHPAALTLDKGYNRLYWFDRKSKYIFSVHNQGSKPKKILKVNEDQVPISMDVFGSYIYWVTKPLETNAKNGQLVRQDKFGRGKLEILFDDLVGQSSIKIYHKRNIKKYSTIDLESLKKDCQRCDQLCVRKHRGVSCMNVDNPRALHTRESCLKGDHDQENFHNIHPLKCNCHDRHKVCNVSSPHYNCHCKKICQINITLNKYATLNFNGYIIVSIIVICFVIACFVLSFYRKEEIRNKAKNNPIQLQVVR